MSQHVEWVDAEHPWARVNTRLGGERWDGDDVDEYTHSDQIVPGEVGVVLSGDDVVVITGSFKKVEEMLREALRQIQDHTIFKEESRG
jgi:hypothetical protein